MKDYFVKVGDLYLTSDGSMSPHQSDSMRLKIADGTQPDQAPRFVRVRPHGYRDSMTDAGQNMDAESAI